MTTVVRHSTLTRSRSNYVYCGRPSKWGNPFTLQSRFDPEERTAVIAKFRKWWYAPARKALRQQALAELTDKQCGCFCHPLPCHVDVIAEYVNSGGTILK